MSSFTKIPRTTHHLPDAEPLIIDPVDTVEPPVCKETHKANDISQYISSSLTDTQRHAVLTEKFDPPRGWQGPLREVGKKNRRAPAFIFDKANYPSLSYSVREDAVYCAECVAFSPAKVLLVSKPLMDWSNAKKQVDSHIKSSDHKTSATRAQAFLQVCNKDQDAITECISQAYKDTVEQNRKALSAIIETIVLCGK